MNYIIECQIGRDHAAQVMREIAQSGNLPKMVREMRNAAKYETGYGIGFLSAIGSELTK